MGQVADEMIRDYIAGHVGKFPDDSFTVDWPTTLVGFSLSLDFSLTLDFQSASWIYRRLAVVFQY